MKTGKVLGSEGRLLWDLFKDHVELALLEWEYEKTEWWRRFIVKGCGAIFFVFSGLFFHVALIAELLRHGISLVDIGLFFGFIYLVAGIVTLQFAKKKISEEEPLHQSRVELKRSLAWIEKHFF